MSRFTTPLAALLGIAAGCAGDPVGDETGAPADSAAQTDSDPGDAWHDDCPVDVAEQRAIPVGEVTLNVACRGAGPTIVFLHGFPEFWYGWDPVMDELAGEFRLVAPDQRGYNLSDKPADVDDYRLELLAADISALLPLVSPDPVLLVAHDWGGPVGWLVAHDGAHVRGFVAANGPHPARFADLLANDPDQQAASSYMAWFRAEGTEDAMAYDDYATLATFFEGVLSEDDLAIYKQAWAQEGALTGGLNWYRANEITPDSVASLMADLPERVAAPTTVLWGLDDTAVLASNAEGLEPYVEDLTVRTFEGVDHWIVHRAPEEIAAALRELDAATR